MASHSSLQLSRLLSNSLSLHSDKKLKIKIKASNSSTLNWKERVPKHGCSKSLDTSKFHFAYSTTSSSRGSYLGAPSPLASSFTDVETVNEDSSPIAKYHSNRNLMEFNRVNCLVWVLGESARSFSAAVESLKIAGSTAELSTAWLGKDVHRWHRKISYQVAIYALLTTAVEVEFLLSHERSSNASVVREILNPRLNLMEEYIESQLSEKHTGLIQWFREVELPRVAGFFIPLLKKWCMDYAGSGVASIVIAISCCAAVAKLGPQHSSSPLLDVTIDDILVELMELSHSLVPVEKGHQLATEAGFELDFLTHFGRKFLPSENTEELEFWIGLAQKKLSLSFQREAPLSCLTELQDEFKAESLAILGLFAYLGRRTRLYLSNLGIKEVDEQVKDFLSYLECGIIFVYPEFSSLPLYQLFMEIVIEELGWLDIYALQHHPISSRERKKCKQRLTQAEREIILSRVFTACYDVFSGFAHFSRSTLQPLDAAVLSFLLRSQSLLSVCLDDYWVVYDTSGETPLSPQTGASDALLTAGARRKAKFSVAREAQHRASAVMVQERFKIKSQHVSGLPKDAGTDETALTTTIDGAQDAKSDAIRESLCRKFSIKLISASSNLWMGTQLLWLDILMSVELIRKKLHGHKITRRESNKLRRTFNDLVSLVPVTILMLLPVSAVGHAAMLAAMKKYIPSMIPSPYSRERLDIVKQLKRTKKMEVRSWSNLEDPSLKIT